ncbi:MAG: ABC transporter ATP-binding protein [Lentisphaeria bacterium]|nr:ABC transporter ATP-binding protein [Lentisphaeria bacterium]
MVSATDNIVVEAVGLTKIFKDFWGRPKARAVNNIDFNIRQGQIFGLLGPNGSGKSTTVKMILGLLYPNRGMLKVFGEEPRDVDMKSRIGYLPEETYLYKYLTAMETLDFFGALFGLSEEKRRERSVQLLDMVGLSHAVNRPVGEFSKGMARRIGLAQALINDPDLVILDEPTSGLDPIGCREVKDVIRLLASRGKTVILCSHLLADVQDVCDEVVILYGGKVRASGELQEILKEEDKTRIISPRLNDASVAELKSWLSAHGVKEVEQVQVDHPNRDLEEFFLDVVRQAQEQSLDTAGAQAGGEVPAYLMAGEDGPAQAKRGKAVLDALRRPEEIKPAKQEEATPKAEAQVDLDRLQKLGAEPEAAKPEEPSAAQVEDEAAAKAREEANLRLSKLKSKE